ncbi:helix-turn-helix domain-containing protein [Paenibacillus sp. CF384]|uniref:helix-turn-helix domain-containing protein n=1 Tax=Paenibacillus sp. CF384 TaxID=1884382 RepID=UPI00089D7EC3|nr:helix-turn-helix transcriptional regulator [Paenibacillus sp. CF384]SDW48462.1 DNA-binding transcriptional regulator, XRE-family HTH domain [Paenibacillus sp. CF384]
MYDIGGNIRRLRKLNMLNQNEFSRKIGISQGSLSDIESGKCKPSIDTVVSIHQTFNCSLEMLLAGNERLGDKDLSDLESRLLHVYRELDLKDKIEILEIASLKLRIQ